jgi:peptidyl-prolyl cis-trans isomerase SurA
MHRIAARIFLFVFVLTSLGAALSPDRARAVEVVERILAVVNDELITEQDLQSMMAPVIAQYRTRFTGEELDARLREMRRQYLNKAIEDRLILSEAKRLQVVVNDGEVDAEMAAVRNKFPNREVFLQSLEEQGLSEKKLWSRFKDQIMVEKLINFEIKSRITVSPGEVTAFYNSNPDKFEQGERVKLQTILIRVSSRTDEEAKAFAEDLYAQIQSGKSFEELAKTYSEGAEAKEGGEMGWRERGQFVGEIDEKVFALQPGEVTAPIKSTLGYHIFKVTQKEQMSSKPLAEVRDKILDYLFSQKLRQRLEAWLENLRKNAYISIR